ncbi:Ig-like domain-containing protein [Rossellomorea aquimaris]|uniref:Ig-like domain-containing protein n=1 Tax=Rossellomorea aquimaris TaxID=189382 RepID=UPI0007D07E36|nr:Ig-like domain-containing protein [Rossellomorea aquimaris]
MNKKKAIKVIAGSTIAASALVATAPAQADAASNLQSVVDSAKMDMKAAYYAYSTPPQTEGKLVAESVIHAHYNKAKKSYAEAKASVLASNATNKDALLADLDSVYNTYISKRVIPYIDAYTYATVRLQPKLVKLEEAREAGNWDELEKYYHEVSYELSAATAILYKFYGEAPRELMLEQYKEVADSARDALMIPVTIKMAYDKAEMYIAAGNLDAAKAQIDKAEPFLSDLDSSDEYTGEFAAGLKTMVVDVKADYEAAMTPMVTGVSAINARELVVSFNKAVDKTDAENLAHYALVGETFTGTPVVSADGKTVTLRTSDELKVTNAKLTVASIKTKADATVKTVEYNTLFTFADTKAPSVASVDAKGTTAVIKFAEPVQTAGTVSLNGSELTVTSDYTLSADGKTLTVTGLTAEKSYKVDIVGAKDFANNIANPIGLNFTVAKAEVDSSKPTVSTSVNGTVITLDFSEELMKQDLNAVFGTDEYAKVTVGTTAFYLTDTEIKDTNDKTKFTLDAASALGGANFINTTVKVESFKDSANNAGDAFTFSTTLAKDTTKPSFASSSAKLLVADDKAATSDVDAIYLTFNEPVKVASGTLTKKVQNGIAYTSSTTTVSDTSGTGVDVDGNGKIEGAELNTVKLSVDLDANSTYTFELANGLVTDLAGNAMTGALTFNVSSGTFTPAPGTVTDSVEFASTPVVVSSDNNIFTLEYAVNVTSSATNAANYTLGGQALPSGTQLQFVDGTKKVRFTLPQGSITANGSYVFEAKNVVDTAGNTLKDGKQTTLVSLKESVAPMATKVSVMDSKTFTVDFSETVKDAVNGSINGLTVKIAGSTVTPATASVSGGKLTVTTTNDFAMTDSISVEFKSTNLVDANGNNVKDGIVSK